MTPRKIKFPPLPGTEDEQWNMLAKEFGITKAKIVKELRDHGCPSWMFDKGFINEWDVRKILINNGYTQKIQPEDEDPEKVHNEWLEGHPFTKKWEETCPYFSYSKNPHYEKPKPAEIINGAKKTVMAKEIDIKRMNDEDKMNLEAGWYCKHETEEDPEFAREREENARELRKHVLTPDDEAKLKEIWGKHNEEREKQLKKHKEKLELEKRLNEIRQEIEDEETEKENNNPMKKYEEEVIRENVRKNLQKGMLSDKEEEEIREKFEKNDIHSVYDILTGVLSLLLPYEPGENIDRSKKMNESDMINIAANLIPRMRETKKNMFYNRHKLPEDKAEDVEKLAKDLSGYSNAVKKEYATPKCEFVENTPSIRGDFDGICQEIMELHRRKNNDYGNAAQRSFEKFGIISYVMRLGDKMNRLETLTNPNVEQKVKGEKIEDTLMDLAAYAIMAIESLRNS